MKKKLQRSVGDKKIFGVCGGIARYLEIDSTIIRLLWVIALFFFGSGFLCYLICALIMPAEKDEPIEYEYIHRADSEYDHN